MGLEVTKTAAPDILNEKLEGVSSDDCKTLLSKITNEMDRNDSYRTQLYCFLGHTLSMLKYNDIAKKCDECCLEDNIFKVVTCKTCTNSKCNDLSSYYQTAIELTKKSKDYLNFYINAAKLCDKYPKFKYNTMPTDVCKKYMKHLKSFMAKDESFWSI
jgi:hypothetical protein